MYQLAHVANTILYRAHKEDMPISPMKLQKLLYFLYGEFLYNFDDSLFSERFEAWKYGPVVDDVYTAFKEYGANRIKKYMLDTNGKLKIVDTDVDWQFRNCLDKVWSIYAPETGIELSKRTHDPKGAWYIAWTNNKRFLTDDNIIKEMEYRNNGRRSAQC